ncbi:MAG: hypothetical protein HC929_18115 [Leptolyngbyaceae cyanobacterium SM2_5_2]|nr:hypothetical protein [Leptolyngbyaceae cyanobacterium SM2_5_2]
MKPNNLYAQLELISEDFPASGSASSTPGDGVTRLLKQHLHHWGRSLLVWLCPSMSPRITVRRNRQGQTWFLAYDPVDGQHRRFYSEQDLRIWLDQRYYQ